MADFRDDDIRYLKRCLDADLDRDPDIDELYWSPGDSWLAPFQRMLIDLEAGTWYELTEKQRAWVGSVYERLFDEDAYPKKPTRPLNRSGYGKTETPEVLKAPLPKKPPGRR